MEVLCFVADLAGWQDSVCKTPAQSVLLFQNACNDITLCKKNQGINIEMKVVMKLRL